MKAQMKKGLVSIELMDQGMIVSWAEPVKRVRTISPQADASSQVFLALMPIIMKRLSSEFGGEEEGESWKGKSGEYQEMFKTLEKSVKDSITPKSFDEWVYETKRIAITSPAQIADCVDLAKVAFNKAKDIEARGEFISPSAGGILSAFGAHPDTGEKGQPDLSEIFSKFGEMFGDIKFGKPADDSDLSDDGSDEGRPT